MTAAAQPDDQPPVYADPAAVDAWMLVVSQLRGDSPADGHSVRFRRRLPVSLPTVHGGAGKPISGR